MSDRVRVLLVGAGRAGSVHGHNLATGVRGAVLQGVADPSEEVLDAASRSFEGVWTETDPLVAVTRDDVDAVIIAAPTFTHAGTAVAALDAGKYVLCEKPLAATMEDAHRIAEAEEASSATLIMAFMRRFDRGFRRVAERISAGDIGRPLLIRSTGRGPGLPPEWAWDTRRAGGLVAEVNSHDIDTIRWLSGQEPISVFASGRAGKRPDIAERYPGFVDVVTAVIDLSDGGLAQFDGACPADYGYDARVEVYGTEGTLLVGGPTQPSALLVRGDGASTDPVRSWRELFADAYRAEMQHLVAVARGDEQPVTSVADGVAALATVVAANRSMASGLPVEVEVGGTR